MSSFIGNCCLVGGELYNLYNLALFSFFLLSLGTTQTQHCEDGEAPSPDSDFDTLIILQQAKQFCIQNIVSCLKEDGDGDTFCSSKCLEDWLESLEPRAVIYIFNDLNDQIVNRNGMVTETNPLLCNATGASTNAVLIGNTQQSAAALFYVAPYVCKNKVALEACLTALEAAQRHVEEYASKAEDSGTPKRYVQHMFTRVLNDLAKSVELSDTQVALCLLNTKSEITSDSYRYFGADYSVNYFQHQLQTAKTSELQLSDDNSSCSSHGSSSDDDLSCDDSSCCTNFLLEDVGNINPTEPIIDIDSQDNNSDPRSGKLPTKSLGPAPFYKTLAGDKTEEDENGNCNHSVPVHYPVHWWHRGFELRKLTQVEYYALVDIKPIPRRKKLLQGKSIQGTGKIVHFV